jgi:hypothetical protein
MAGVERIHLHIVVREGPAAGFHLGHHAGSILEVEHGIAVHLPIDVARMGVVGVFHRHRPALKEAVFDLGANLCVCEIG